MKSISALLLLPALCWAAPAVESRASPLITITSANPTGDGCPAGSFSTSFTTDKTGVTIGYDSYQTQVGTGVDPSLREKYCDIFLTLSYPIGCTSAVVNTTYHGFAQISSGVTGTFAATETISPGTLSGSTPPSVFTSQNFAAGKPYTKNNQVSIKETIKNANQKSVSLTVRTRLSLTASNGFLDGTLTDDDATIVIVNQKTCW